MFFSSCNNNSKINDANPSFDVFLNRFNNDSAFQFSCISFPLKYRKYDSYEDKDTLLYLETAHFKMLDFSKSDNIQNIKQINTNNIVIEVRGLENGLITDFIFKKIKGAWMLVKIDDQST